jgi:hypothetical protein
MCFLALLCPADFPSGENEANVRYVLDAHPCLKLVPAVPRLGGPGLMAPADPLTLRELAESALGSKGAGKEAQQDREKQQKEGAEARGCARAAAASKPGVAGEPAAAAAASCKVCLYDSGASSAAVGLWSLTAEEASMVQRFDPSAPNSDSIGFFIARFLKY